MATPVIYFSGKNKLLDRCLNKWIFSFFSKVSLVFRSQVLCFVWLAWLFGFWVFLGFFFHLTWDFKKSIFFSFSILQLWVSTSNPLPSLPTLAYFLV